MIPDVLHKPSILQSKAAATLTLGYVPLTDAAPLLVAKAKGFFTRHGLDVQLSAMPAWAAIRDRVAFGALDGAQMLSPMAIATTLGLGGVQRDIQVAATLGLNGNTITLSEQLWAEIRAVAPHEDAFPLRASVLAAALERRKAAGRPPPVFAVVFAFSSHNYLLRYWLATGGIDPEHDIKLVVVPPPEVSGQLASGAIDGFCAGEPWGSRAVELRAGRIALTTADIWQNHPEKVLAFTADTVARDRPRVVAAVAAMIQAGQWLDAPENREEAVQILCRDALAGIPERTVMHGLDGRLQRAPDGDAVPTQRPLFHASGASFPFVSHGAWWLAQMQRWQHVSRETPKNLPSHIWQPALWREAAQLIGAPSPLGDAKTEGGHDAPWSLPATPASIPMHPDRFIDNAVFDFT